MPPATPTSPYFPDRERLSDHLAHRAPVSPSLLASDTSTFDSSYNTDKPGSLSTRRHMRKALELVTSSLRSYRRLFLWCLTLGLIGGGTFLGNFWEGSHIVHLGEKIACSTLTASSLDRGRAGLLEEPKLSESAVGGTRGREKFEVFDRMSVLNYEEPSDLMGKQLKGGVRYVTSVSFGGHANQFIEIYKLLYLAKITNRVAIIPTLMPLHFSGPPTPVSSYFDLKYFYHSSQIPAVEFSDLKPIVSVLSPHTEQLSCWSVQEATTGGANTNTESLDAHGVRVNFWPLPPLARGWGGYDIAFDALRIFDFDIVGRMKWVERARKNFLPQKAMRGSRLSKQNNVKEGFNLQSTPAPNDQVFCLDNSLFIGTLLFPNKIAPAIPLAPEVEGEEVSWREAGQYLRFNQEVESLTDIYLMELFDITIPSELPPFITVHLRRTDFEQFRGLTPLENFITAVNNVVSRIQARLDDPSDWGGPGREYYSTFDGLPAKKYAVIACTDEPSGSAFLEEVKSLGWKVVDHEFMKTEEKLGSWWPTILDGAILARGQGFVGTQRSTFSNIAALRVKYWRGGLADWAKE